MCFIVVSFLSTFDLSISNSGLNADNAEYVSGTINPSSSIFGPFGENVNQQP